MIDAHVHLWDPALGYSWLDGAPEVYRRRFGLDDYAGAPGAAERVVLVEANDDSGAEDARHAALVDDARVAAVVTRVARRGAIGVRGGRVSGPGDVAPVPMAGGVLELLVAGTALRSAVSLADGATGPVVLDHLADPPPASDGRAAVREWRAGISRLARRRRTAIKISGVLGMRERLNDAELRAAAAHVLDRFGEDRVLVGSDWPICLRFGSLADSLGLAVELAGGTEASDAAVRRFYGVSG